MELWASLMSAVVVIVTALIGYFQYKVKAQMITVAKEGKGLAERLVALEAQVKECEDGRAEQREQIAALISQRDEQKQRELRLREEVEGLAFAVGRIERMKMTAVIEADSDGTILKWNPAATVLFKWSESEAVGRNVSMIVGSDHKHAHSKAIHALKRADREPRKEPLYAVAMDKNGQRFPVSVALNGWKDNGDGEWVLCADIRLITDDEYAAAVKSKT